MQFGTLCEKYLYILFSDTYVKHLIILIIEKLYIKQQLVASIFLIDSHNFKCEQLIKTIKKCLCACALKI